MPRQQEETLRREAYFGGVALLALVAVLNLPAPLSARVKSFSRDNLTAFQNLLWLMTDKVQGAVSSSAPSGISADERERLLAEIANLRNEVLELKALEKDNQDLRDQLRFEQRGRHKLLLCRVVARGDTSGWWQTVRLNRGEAAGIRPNMAAVTTEGLVGRVTEVSPKTCDVLLLSDPNCRVACKFAGTNGVGIARGGGVTFSHKVTLEMLCAPNPLRVDYIAKERPLKDDDRVVTSGLGGVFPEGIPVGRVTRIGMDPSGLFQWAELAPAANLAELNYVFVIVKANAKPEAGDGSE